ncbi:hypothetical protein SCH4B_1498 [Ruegeria sp. TrichCH4B]|nr:hypothetical protein SCH4B_1498 [Ruegeria sp. TrichCH4B]
MTRRGKALPIIRHRVIPCPALAKDQAGFLPQLTRGCHTKCAPHIRTTIRLQAAPAGFGNVTAQGDLAVACIHRATGEDEFVGHKGRLSTALPHQHPWVIAVTVAHHDHRGSIANRGLVDLCFAFTNLCHRCGLRNEQNGPQSASRPQCHVFNMERKEAGSGRRYLLL